VFAQDLGECRYGGSNIGELHIGPPCRNTIGFIYWIVRFCFQCIFYVMVLIAVMIQVYDAGDARTSLIGLFIAIIAMASLFLWLEVLQFLHNSSRYLA